MIQVELHKTNAADIAALQEGLPDHLANHGFANCLVTKASDDKEIVTYGNNLPYMRIYHDHAGKDMSELIRVIQAYPYVYSILISSIGCNIPPN